MTIDAVEKTLERDYGAREMKFWCSRCAWAYVAACRSIILDRLDEREAVLGFLKHDCKNVPIDKKVLA